MWLGGSEAAAPDPWVEPEAPPTASLGFDLDFLVVLEGVLSDSEVESEEGSVDEVAPGDERGDPFFAAGTAASDATAPGSESFVPEEVTKLGCAWTGAAEGAAGSGSSTSEKVPPKPQDGVHGPCE